MKHFDRFRLAFAMTCLSLSLTIPAFARIEKDSRFPDIPLKTLDGKSKFDMKDLKGKVVIVDFWAQWCEPCKISMPYFNELAKKYKGKLVVIGINVDDDIKLAQSFLKEFPSPHVKMLSDSSNAFVKKAGVTTMPTSFVLDKKGIVRVAHQGFREDDKKMMESEVRKLLKGK